MRATAIARETRLKRSRIPLFALGMLLACLAIFAGCSPATVPDGIGGSSDSPSAKTEAPKEPEPEATPSAPEPEPEPTLEDQVVEIVSAMTLEEKVAQMSIVTPEMITGVDTATQAGPATESALGAYPVGGIVYFQKNLIDPDQTKTMIANTQAYAKEATGLPLFIAVDEEGGTVRRIAGNPGFDVEDAGDMAAIGATGDASQACEAATTIGSYLSELGFNLDFAPDSDICGDPQTDVMAQRSFGTDPDLVASMVQAQVEGFGSAGILCCAKHFPGIGGVMGDSHEGAIVSNKTLDELRAWELKPFEAAIAADVPFVMVGHLSLPTALGTDAPASINSAVVTDLLRNELGYTGIIITDAMEMGAIGEFCTADQAGVAAIEAGVDIVLMPSEFPAAYQGVIDAVNDGRIAESRIDESVERIVGTKLSYLGD
ncbi:glycoside hydrolase family 3 protein [Raoultibacter massiliensis]|uniref:glycoside hydrolase family 3 protein n=1 Tax=Raoultibacter massiliensis TaxID=1852371 RepID=UPI003A8D34D6